MKLIPVNDKIVVKPLTKEEEVTESGLILPDTVDQGKLMEGEVVAIGEGMFSANAVRIPVVCDVGDKILYNKHAQTHEYGDFVIMSVNEILSIVKE
jgi:chaperonin GroES